MTRALLCLSNGRGNGRGNRPSQLSESYCQRALFLFFLLLFSPSRHKRSLTTFRARSRRSSPSCRALRVCGPYPPPPLAACRAGTRSTPSGSPLVGRTCLRGRDPAGASCSPSTAARTGAPRARYSTRTRRTCCRCFAFMINGAQLPCLIETFTVLSTPRW